MTQVFTDVTCVLLVVVALYCLARIIRRWTITSPSLQVDIGGDLSHLLMALAMVAMLASTASAGLIPLWLSATAFTGMTLYFVVRSTRASSRAGSHTEARTLRSHDAEHAASNAVMVYMAVLMANPGAVGIDTMGSMAGMGDHPAEMDPLMSGVGVLSLTYLAFTLMLAGYRLAPWRPERIPWRQAGPQGCEVVVCAAMLSALYPMLT